MIERNGMSKKILDVQGSATRECRDFNGSSFYSEHKPEDIEKWLKYKGVDYSSKSFDYVFDNDWNCFPSDDQTDTFEVQFNEFEDDSEDECEFDEEIQKFLDEEPLKDENNKST